MPPGGGAAEASGRARVTGAAIRTGFAGEEALDLDAVRFGAGRRAVVGVGAAGVRTFSVCFGAGGLRRLEAFRVAGLRRPRTVATRFRRVGDLRELFLGAARPRLAGLRRLEALRVAGLRPVAFRRAAFDFLPVFLRAVFLPLAAAFLRVVFFLPPAFLRLALFAVVLRAVLRLAVFFRVGFFLGADFFRAGFLRVALPRPRAGAFLRFAGFLRDPLRRTATIPPSGGLVRCASPARLAPAFILGRNEIGGQRHGLRVPIRAGPGSSAASRALRALARRGLRPGA